MGDLGGEPTMRVDLDVLRRRLSDYASISDAGISRGLVDEIPSLIAELEAARKVVEAARKEWAGLPPCTELQNYDSLRRGEGVKNV